MDAKINAFKVNTKLAYSIHVAHEDPHHLDPCTPVLI